VLATTGDRGTDASPRGGPPGFVRVLDDRRLALGDLAGNRRLDSFENVLANPAVGLLFLVPGMGETLRVNGRASLTTDPAVLDACTIDGVRPGVAVGVDVDEVFLHCAKAFRRSGLWDPATWPADGDRPRAADIWKSQLGFDAPSEAIEADLEAGYRATMWEPGGVDTA
jgi:PPOX class probable FMN-dependent enzyme